MTWFDSGSHGPTVSVVVPTRCNRGMRDDSLFSGFRQPHTDHQLAMLKIVRCDPHIRAAIAGRDVRGTLSGRLFGQDGRFNSPLDCISAQGAIADSSCDPLAMSVPLGSRRDTEQRSFEEWPLCWQSQRRVKYRAACCKLDKHMTRRHSSQLSPLKAPWLAHGTHDSQRGIWHFVYIQYFVHMDMVLNRAVVAKPLCFGVRVT